MKKSILVSISFILILVMCVVTLNFNNTLGATCSTTVSKENGTIVLKYYDDLTGQEISADTALKYFEGSYAYEYGYYNGTMYYFYKGKQISKAEYDKGIDLEKADNLAKAYGSAGIRVHNNKDIENAFDDIYKNLKSGIFKFVVSNNEYKNIDWNQVKKYYNSHYGLDNYKRNFYKYSEYGEYYSRRYGLDLDESNIPNNGFFTLNTLTDFRLSGEERVALNKMVTKMLPLLKGDGSDYDKIMRSYNYVSQTATYLADEDGYTNLRDSVTSAYDVFLKKKGVCIGFATAFSYLMERQGIESYIVDNISINDPNTHSFASTHTYNIVKLDGKWYRIDIGSSFLGGISSTTLTGGTLANVSSTKYNTSGKQTSYKFDMNVINNYISESSALGKTTGVIYDTTSVKPSTVLKTTSGTTKKTTKLVTTKPSTTVIGSTTTSSPVITTGTTNTTVYTNPTTGSGQIVTSAKTTRSTWVEETTISTTKKIEEKDPNKEKIGVNIILCTVAAFVIVFYLLYKLFVR